ncbi:proline-rich protein, partial [Boletus edulis]
DSDEDASAAQAQVIASLRAQLTDLFSQVTQLNSKLVSSYDRVSDLEDELHTTSASLRNASVTISSLELERSHHLAALNTGLLVEKAHVTAELNRLMERATEEAAQRGQAESARQDIEKDLDDLSASLFGQANTMVAEARLNQAKSERKVQDAEQALKIAEDAVKDMQVQMQALQAEKEAADRDAQGAKLTMGKGKWVERDDSRVGEIPSIRFMTTHAPHAEFLAFVAHLRGLRASQTTPPVILTLLSQPFIARLINEDSEPTVRLDLAPSLNWLSRRSVLAAIHTGMLTVEPLPFSSLVQELHQHPQSLSTSSLSCALCGTLIARLPSTSPVSRTLNTNGGSWFKYPLALGSTQNHNAGTQPAECEPPGQVYIFRLAAATTAASSRPPLSTIASSRVIQAQTQNSPYPLCTSNYCLTRLRSTCSLWAFVRFGVVERIWEEEESASPQTSASAGNQPASSTFSAASEKPPVPPRRRRLWEMASALGERAASWGKESGENTKEKEKDSTKKIPSPPPSHPSPPHPHAESLTSRVDAQEPPPLPKRNVVRETAMDDCSCHGSDSLSTPVDEIGFATPPSEASSPPYTTPRPTSPESSTQDHLPPPSPRTVPLPLTPTTSIPISRVASPALRPRSRLSSPASPPPASRPSSPAVSRSRAGSPVPTEIVPSPRHAPSASHIRGKASPLAPSSRPASPAPAAPPLPRRAPGRRAADESKASELEVTPETKCSNAEGDDGVDVVKEEITSQATSVPAPTMEATLESPKDITVCDTNTARGGVQDVMNGTSVMVDSDPHPLPASEGDGCASVDTASTKRSSSTEEEGFASDATWEERTWKELVRLKEEMFWARIGGIRALQG